MGSTTMKPRAESEQEHSFVLVVEGVAELDADVEKALFEAGCDDATISVRSGRISLAFTRGLDPIGRPL